MESVSWYLTQTFTYFKNSNIFANNLKRLLKTTKELFNKTHAKSQLRLTRISSFLSF